MNDNIKSYNLIHQPWIPVIRENSGKDWIAPWQMTEGIGGHLGDPILRLAAPRPDFNGALHEFLIGLLTTCFTPEDEDQWREFWKNPPSPDQLKQAFMKYEHAFNLDGDGPRFMQDFDELEGENIPVSGLLMDEPGSNTLVRNADHFIHRGGIKVLGRAAATMALFTLQTYAPSGGAGHRTSLRGGGPLTTIVTTGNSLWETLWPNVETKEQLKSRAGRKLMDDPETIFPWFTHTQTSEKNTGRKVTPDDAHPLQVYWGMPRRIRLNFIPAGDVVCSLTNRVDDFVIADYLTKNYGIEYSEGWKHPLSPYYRQKADTPELLPIHPQPGGISYRHWLGLVLKTSDDLRVPAECILNVLKNRYRSVKSPLLSSFGYDMDNMKARSWTISQMPLQIFENEKTEQDIIALTPRLVHSAEQVASQLTSSIKHALFENPKDARGDFSYISDRFWRETEADFFHLLDVARKAFEKTSEYEGSEQDAMPALAKQWLTQVLKPTAERLFDEYASTSDIQFKHMQRLVRARHSLISTLRGNGTKSTAPGVKLFKTLNIVTPAEQAKKSKQIAEAHQ